MKIKLPKGYNKSDIAESYYKIKHPERNYPRDQAKKQFFQDKNIDKKVLRAIYKAVYEEGKALLK